MASSTSAQPIAGLSERAQALLKPRPNQIVLPSKDAAARQQKLSKASI